VFLLFDPLARTLGETAGDGESRPYAADFADVADALPTNHSDTSANDRTAVQSAAISTRQAVSERIANFL